MLPKFKKWEYPLTITMIFFGIILSIQFKTQQDVINSLDTQKQEDLVAIVKNLNDKRSTLLTEIDDLTKQKNTFLDKAQAGESVHSSMESDLHKYQMATGTIPMSGPGINVSITTSDTSIMYLDLIDIINELWATGAEAVTVNDVRITSATVINDIQDGNKTAIAINGKKLLSPIIIKALGDPQTLETGLTFFGGIFTNLSTLYNIHPEVRRESSINFPATNSK